MPASIRTYLRFPYSLGSHRSAHQAALLRDFTHVLGCRRSFSASRRRNIRLINVNTLSLEEFHEKPPEYALLSHIWGDSEVSFQEWQRNEPDTREKQGYEKIGRACAEAAKLGYGYLWCDTNCIDKTSSAGLSEAINSMFAWYKNSAVCFAYLADVRPLSPKLVASLNSQNYQSVAQRYERMAGKIRDVIGSRYPILYPPPIESATSDLSTTSSLQVPERTQHYQKRAQQYKRMAGEISDVLGFPHPKLKPVDRLTTTYVAYKLSLRRRSNSGLNTTRSLVYSDARAAFPSDIQVLERSNWFTRGWTLQELLAPEKLIFFANDWSPIGRKQVLSSVLSHITGIDEGCPVFYFSKNGLGIKAVYNTNRGYGIFPSWNLRHQHALTIWRRTKGIQEAPGGDYTCVIRSKHIGLGCAARTELVRQRDRYHPLSFLPPTGI